jgi:hypothetical protein
MSTNDFENTEDSNVGVAEICEGCNGDPRSPVGYENKGQCLRAEIKRVASRVKRYIQTSKDTTPTSDDSERQNQGEMIANATLSFRHLEDAAMRIGKSMQAYQGGVSILDKIREKELRDRATVTGVKGASDLNGAQNSTGGLI